MSIIKDIFAGATGGPIGAIADIIAQFKGKPFGDAEAAQLQLQISDRQQKRDEMIQQGLQQELAQKVQFMVAEVQQDDAYVKRARPSIIYTGLVVVIWNGVVISLILTLAQLVGKTVTPVPMNLPADFWYVWGGVSGIYIWSRSRYDKQGAEAESKLGQAVTGTGKGIKALFQ